jgi:uncharacterized protein (DUF488 family)
VSTRRTGSTRSGTTRSFEELVAALHAWDVTTLVDIRSFTRSRANPQFNAASLRRRLPRRGITYRAIPGLGGRRGRQHEVDPLRNAGWEHAAFKNYADYAETPKFEEALSELLALAAASPCAIMCAEAVWWRCHRRIVADYAITRGLRVHHIFTEQEATRATRTPFARVDRRTGTLRYPPAKPRPSRARRRAARR